jgi:cytochrome b6-f complex iron-sulfur subunit
MSETPISEHIVAEPSPQGDAKTRRAFIAAAGAAGLCYVAALGYPIYRYLDSPNEMALGAAAVTEVTLKDAQKLAAGSASTAAGSR